MAVWIFCCSCNIDLALLDPCSPVISTAAMLSSSLSELCAYGVAVFFSVLSDGPCYIRAKRPNYDEDNICYLAPAREAARTASPLKGISVCVCVCVCKRERNHISVQSLCGLLRDKIACAECDTSMFL